jgi:hypothetical protein
MADDLRRQLREVEQALMALDGVIAVRREYVALRERVGWCQRDLAGLEALVDAAAKLRSQRDGLEMKIACRDVEQSLWASCRAPLTLPIISKPNYRHLRRLRFACGPGHSTLPMLQLP